VQVNETAVTKQHYPITEVLAHSGRMVLLDELVDYGVDYAVAAVDIRADSMLSDGVNGVPTWVGLEYMAQTIGAFTGLEDIRNGLRPQIGLLLGCRSYKPQLPMFAIGARLIVTATLELRDERNLAVFSCEIQEGGVSRAKGDVKAFRPDDVFAFLRGEGVG
jgi:predicted hotdog family 3-hydroxylacyl-ACP dehydratase